jgi:RNA polymerase sigma-70 factor (ECF subfamily)
MSSNQWLIEHFEASRSRLKGLAYRLLGSTADAEDALHDAWIRMSRSAAPEGDQIANIEGWLTTVVARVCLNRLRARKARPEDPYGGALPDLIITDDEANGPEREVLFAEQVGLALQVVLETLSPPERIAFVLHDLFGLSFTQISPILDRTPEAARQLASRGRRRVQGVKHDPADGGTAAQRTIVDAFFAASRTGDLDELLRLLHPDVVFRADGGNERPAASATIRGSAEVARRATMFALPDTTFRPVTVNGSIGVVVQTRDGPVSIMAFTISAGQISEIYSLLDRERIRRLLPDRIARPN